MATYYALGDIQGCYEEFVALLERINFSPSQDHLWLVGDLVNRGPNSIEVLQWVRGLGERAHVVLGNHELHLLGIASGLIEPRRNDTLIQILEAHDGPELLEWIRSLPLIHSDTDLNWTMVHAAIPPQWDLQEAHWRAACVESALQGPSGLSLAASLAFDSLPTHEPDPESAAWDWLRFNAAVLTRTRYCTAEGEFQWGTQPPSDPRFQPWYTFPGRATQGQGIVYGHWAANGLTETEATLGLDSGCVWGGKLTAVRLQPGGKRGPLWQWECPGHLTPP